MEEINKLQKMRREKLVKLAELNINPYAYAFDQQYLSADISGNFSDFENKVVSIAGRMMSVRLMGKAAFFHLQDRKGRIQVYIRMDKVGDIMFEVFKILDIGDFVGVAGPVFKTKTRCSPV